MTQEVKKEEVGYVVNFVTDLGNGRQISITGNLPKGATKEDINVEFDKLRAPMDRQQAKSASRGAGEEIDQLILRRNSAVDDLVRIDNKSEEKGGLSSAERSQREAAVLHIDKLDKDIKFKQTILDKLNEESK